MENGKNMPNA
jgi:hypothetical protein